MKKITLFFVLVLSFFLFLFSVSATSNLSYDFPDELIADAEEDTTTEDQGSEEEFNGTNGDSKFNDINYGEVSIIMGNGDCSTIFKKSDGTFNELGEMVQDIFTLIKFAAPTLVLVFSTIDYMKAISAQNADEIKKANGRFVKRLVAGIAVFFLPFLLDFIFDISGLYGLDMCGIR